MAQSFCTMYLYMYIYYSIIYYLYTYIDNTFIDVYLYLFIIMYKYIYMCVCVCMYVYSNSKRKNGINAVPVFCRLRDSFHSLTFSRNEVIRAWPNKPKNSSFCTQSLFGGVSPCLPRFHTLDRRKINWELPKTCNLKKTCREQSYPVGGFTYCF